LTPDDLPIVPELTPGYGIAGVIMLVTGSFYGMVGIRNKGLHVFLSAAYLASLAVTVLIVYVMAPPVSHGIQGAYVVAIVLTGLILGGASLLIINLVEGLGCLFGGFCVAMWLLVLKPGGLLNTVPQVVVFIVCWTFAGFATSFHHWTRPYGLIGLMSFGGATVVVLGIDCFSRAGLKEFWAYIWNLNQNLFPLGATTYPLTKGMKVEIACIIIIFLIGLLAQSKIWAYVEKQRARRAWERQSNTRDLRREEEKVGRRIETATARQREYWESVYGNKDGIQITESTLDSEGTIKGGTSINGGAASTSTSMDHQRQEPVEMDELSTMPKRTLTTDSLKVGPRPKPGVGAGFPQPRNSVAFMATRTRSHEKKRESKAVRESTIPDLVPLPFVVHVIDEHGASSSATAAEAEESGSKRHSHGGDRLSKISQRSSTQPNRLSRSHSTEQLVDDQDHGDDRSSVAATIDDEPYLSDDGLEMPVSPPKDRHKDAKSPQNAQILLEPEKENSQSKKDEKVRPLSYGLPYADAPVVEPEPQPTPLTRDTLPRAMPRVASSYRTNEWAKHASEAEPPVVKEIEDSAEAPIRVMIKDIQKRDEEAAAMLAPKEPSKAPTPLQRTPSEVTLNRVASPPPVQSPATITRTPSEPTMSRTPSTQSIQSMQSGHPAPQAVVIRPATSQSLRRPIETHAHAQLIPIHESRPGKAFSQAITESPSESLQTSSQRADYFQPRAETLLSKRESMLRNKSSYGSLNGVTTPDPSSRPSTAGGRSSKTYDLSLGRASPLPQGQGQVPLVTRPLPTRLSSSPVVPQEGAFDSHQPRRGVTSPISPSNRESQLAQWRASVRQEIDSTVQHTKQQSSAAMVNGNMVQQRLVQEREREVEKQRREVMEGLVDERMRQGDMLVAHREAMRRMQGGARAG
jgi:hypothetical protein